MGAWKLKAWRSASLAALTLAACNQPTDDAVSTSPMQAPGDPESDAPLPDAGGESGESGEAGAVSAYAGLAGEDLTALRLLHLKGFVLIAQKVADAGASDDAAILVAQGILEVYEGAPEQFGDFDIAPVRAVAEAAGQPAAEVKRRIETALDAIDAARAPLRAHNAVLAARLVDVAAGLYQTVVRADYVDPIEYQHSLGAALSARDALNTGRDALRRADRRAYDEAKRELDRFIALWPAATPPATPATYPQVLAQASRVRLALSPYL